MEAPNTNSEIGTPCLSRARARQIRGTEDEQRASLQNFPHLAAATKAICGAFAVGFVLAYVREHFWM
jgi:hypothetical protein